MAGVSFPKAVNFALAFVFLSMGICSSICSSSELSPYFYSKTCPDGLRTVRKVVKAAILNETRMGASLLRLHFHDCFVDGCDGSILLDDNATFTGEQTARPNNNSVRGFNVIADIKTAVEAICPGVVSCADIVAIAARDSVRILGGPSYKVKLGRRDSYGANFTLANNGGIPSPASSLQNLTTRFNALGLSVQDLVALSGGHTIGLARCVTFRTRIYNETNINSKFAKLRQKTCPASSSSGSNNLAPLDVQTPDVFDNDYYKNLINLKGLLHSDQVLYNNASTDSLVKRYSKKHMIFFEDFVVAMLKMGDITPLTGSQGEIRKRRIKLPAPSHSHPVGQ